MTEPEKRMSWMIDGAFLDFKYPVTEAEAREDLKVLREVWDKSKISKDHFIAEIER